MPVSASRAEAIEESVQTFMTIGSPAHLDPDLVRTLAGRSYDRAHDPDGRQRPLAIYWGDGRCFVVDRVLESRRAASMKVGGQCHCGQIAYTAEVDPAKVTICHCVDCQI